MSRAGIAARFVTSPLLRLDGGQGERERWKKRRREKRGEKKRLILIPRRRRRRRRLPSSEAIVSLFPSSLPLARKRRGARRRVRREIKCKVYTVESPFTSLHLPLRLIGWNGSSAAFPRGGSSGHVTPRGGVVGANHCEWAWTVAPFILVACQSFLAVFSFCWFFFFFQTFLFILVCWFLRRPSVR